MPSTVSSAIGDFITSVGARLLRVRWLVRTPVWLYRARLGGLFGTRLLMLEHTGRRSGKRRYVVLEVIARPASDTYVVVSGFGERAQWFRNVRVTPHVRVVLGSHRPAPALARLLDYEQATAALDAYRDRHPGAWARFKAILENTLGAPLDAPGTELPIIALQLFPDDRSPALARKRRQHHALQN